MFFERRTQSSIKHRRLRYLLLLSLRVALLLLIALAFANPFVSRVGGPAGGRKMLVIAVDNSFSMRYGDHLARAKQQALNAVSQSASGRARPSAGHRLARAFPDAAGGGGRSAQGRHPIHPALRRTELLWRVRARAADHRAILAHSARSALRRATCRNRRLPPAFADLRLGSDTNLIFHSVADSKEPNWMVESVTAPAKIYDPKKVRVQAVIAGIGTDGHQAHRFAGAGWQGARKQIRGCSRQRPRLGRVSVARIAARLPQRRDPHRTRRLAARRRPFRFRDRTRPIRTRCCFCIPPARIATSCTIAPRSNRSPKPASLSSRWPWSRPPISRFPSTPSWFFPTSDRMPPGLENSLRAYVAGGGSLLVALGPHSAALTHVPVSNEAIQGSSYASRRRLALSNRRDGRRRASRAAPRQQAGWRASSIR